MPNDEGCDLCRGKTPPPGARCRACKRTGAPPKHTCHAKGCKKEVPPRMLMCPTHWRMVPRLIQREVWAAYVPGQEIRKDPTREYLDVMQRAIDAVHREENERPF